MVEQLTRDTILENKFGVDLVVIEKNKKSGIHRHNHSETVLYIAQGQGTILIDDKSISVKAGERVYIPAKSFHGVITTDLPMHFISMQTPPILNQKTGQLDLEEKI